MSLFATDTFNRSVMTEAPEETRRVAAEILAALEGPAVLALYGPLGSGKTCFTQGLAQAMGIRQAVTSPTFTLINEYPAARPLYHIDLYRLHNAEDALAAGIEDYLDGNGITVIEWPERALELLPRTTLHIRFAVTGKRSRHLTCSRSTTGASG